MLEDELTHVLAEDRELKHLIVIDTPGKSRDRAKATSAKSPISYCRPCSNPTSSEKETGNWNSFMAGHDGEDEAFGGYNQSKSVPWEF